MPKRASVEERLEGMEAFAGALMSAIAWIHQMYGLGNVTERRLLRKAMKQQGAPVLRLVKTRKPHA